MSDGMLKELLLKALSEIARKDAVIEDQKKVIESGNRIIAELNELLRLKRAKRYSPSTEQMETLFQENEAVAAAEAEDEGGTVEVKGFRRRKKARCVAELPADTPVVVIRQDQVAQSVVAKFDDHLPLYRQEEMFRWEGVGLSRQSLAGWIIKYYEALLPLERLMAREVYASVFLNKDETPMQVLDVKGPNGLPSGNGFVYITIGSTWDKAGKKMHAVALMRYIQGRGRDVLMEDLDTYGYHGPVMTDGLKAYLGIPVHYVCWVHAVRAFKDILKANRDEPNARRLMGIIGGIYRDDEENRKLLVSGAIDEGTFLAKRKEASMPRINAFMDAIEDVRRLYSPGGAMGKAIAYIDCYRDLLTGYLDTIEATPSNNCSERIAKSFATGRNYVLSKDMLFRAA